MFGEGGLFKRLPKKMVEWALEAEVTHHLGYEKDGHGSGSSRKGSSTKTLKTEQGDLEIEVPRDRAGRFEAPLVPKHQRRIPGLDDKILS
jgi:transposase-like protein